MNADTQTVNRLENGEIIILPEPFFLTKEEQSFLNPACVSAKGKSIKFFLPQQKLWGMTEEYRNSPVLNAMFMRYVNFAQGLIHRLLPAYTSSLIMGNTSFRPVEAEDRIQSKRHDDRLLHVDAFPSRPMNGKRILRVFTNIHPAGRPRLWNTGEPFAKVAERFVPQISAPLPGSRTLLKWLKITKDRRSLYDHYMLHIHDRMKFDDHYQKTAPHTSVSFSPGSSWIVFSDQVSHAALSGQHLLEQTFLLPPEAMVAPAVSPLKILEKIKGTSLI